MLLTNQLDHILGQVSKVKILRFLIKTQAELNGREIASAIGLSHVKAHIALKELNRHGVVVMRYAGRSILYHLNSSNILVTRLLVPLFEREEKLKEIVGEMIMKCVQPISLKSVILFGSFATSSARPNSDIDLLVISSKTKDADALKKKLESIEETVTNRLGNRLAPIVIDEKEFKKRYRKNDHLIRNIVRDGKVIFGTSIPELVKQGL